ncbi:enoyl-CoA hydratase-related protein [Dactylosporangium sp. NPDC051484]|uniref:enoyl-CoA hydratase-related protein n=1 Tax=Dactylosporangium sp. NPDC051484 TaxID=3154942 RepID=UPI00344EE75A
MLTVQLDRAEAAHARNQVMRDELASLWRAVAADRRVPVVILTGAGGRLFCAGTDLGRRAARRTRSRAATAYGAARISSSSPSCPADDRRDQRVRPRRRARDGARL